jgi:geranyl diphosphate 2-C-methyltransferase
MTHQHQEVVDMDSIVTRTEFEARLAKQYHEKQNDPINLLLGEVDGLYHHHFGIGDFNRSVLELTGEAFQHSVVGELHRLENSLSALLVDAVYPLAPTDRVMDGGSGRGGTAFMLHDRYGCRVDGVNFAPYQVEFSRALAQQRGVAEEVVFHCQNMVCTEFPDDSFDLIITNETTMLVESLDELFTEFARLLRPGGRYALITWCINDAVSQGNSAIDQININYECKMHWRSTYQAELAEHGFVANRIYDFSELARPYWELRNHSEHKTGVESAFLEGYDNGSVQEILTVTDYIPASLGIRL